jgi:acetyl-CoA carboxylase carboxyl transferase subunit beta
MVWFPKTKKLKSAANGASKGTPQPAAKGEAMWEKCSGCGEVIYVQDWERNWNVCPLCGHHDALPVRRRLEMALDPGSFEELDADLTPQDPLGFVDAKKYRDRLRSTAKATGLKDAFVSGTGLIDGMPVSVGCFAFQFMGGSMGSVVGEKVARIFDRAYERRLPSIVFSSTGGARMQEGIFSLMQMPKTAAALNRYRQVRKPYISVMLHPTTGGVSASFAWLGDVVVAEPKALIGFAGPRVIEQTIREKLPEGFQRAEYLLEHGMIDAIVKRPEMKAKLSQILSLLA